MNFSEPFKHGMNPKSFPLDSRNNSLDSSPISSIVSRQSEEKPGQKTCILLIFSFGKFYNLFRGN